MVGIVSPERLREYAVAAEKQLVEEAKKKQRKPRLDPRIIRIGDRVRIISGKPVLRVGYPKTVEDYYEELNKDSELHDKLQSVLNHVAGIPEDHQNPKGFFCGVRLLADGHLCKRTREKTLWKLAYFKAKIEGFGGTLRSVHFCEDQVNLVGRTAEVIGVLCKQTGEYYGPTGGYCSYTMEYDYECGGLSNQKTVKILELDLDPIKFDQHYCDIKPVKNRRNQLNFYEPTQFLATDCEKIHDDRNSHKEPSLPPRYGRKDSSTHNDSTLLPDSGPASILSEHREF